MEEVRTSRTLSNLQSILSTRLTVLLNKYQPPADVVLIVTALLVGLLTGVGAVIFRFLIRGVAWIGYVWIPMATSEWGTAYVVFVPAIGGLMVGLLVYYFAPEAKGHGVPEVMEAVALRGGVIRPVVAVVKSLASSISIGTGGSVGREGPIVQIGSAIGSTIGQLLNLSADRVSNLVACGAAAGIAATFNAPIAGVIFALEVIMGGRFGVRYFSSVVVSAVAASVIGRFVFGDVAAFMIPFEYGINSLWEFGFYAIMGILAAVTGVAFVRLLYWSEDLFEKWKGVREWVKPAIGGVLLGLLALAYPLAMDALRWTGTPHVYNVGYEVIESALASQLLLAVAVALLLLKLLATSITLGSGGSGGVFAPSLFMGAMLGVAFQLAMSRLFPDLLAPPGAYALVGMAAVFSASAHAPITAVLILFELTGDYRIILPLMLTVVIATMVAQRMLKGESIYTLKLTRRGVHVRRGRDEDILQSVTVEEAMSHDVAVVSTTTTLNDLTASFIDTHHHGFLVLDESEKLWGIVTITDLEGVSEDSRLQGLTVADVGTTWPKLKVAFPDDTIGNALATMGTRGLGRLPVVARDDPYHLLGIVRRQDIVLAYDLALTRRAEIQNRAREMARTEESNADFAEVILRQDDLAIGQTVAEIAPQLPLQCVLISIKRDGKTIIPHGDTIFQPGDHVTAFVDNHEMDRFFHCIHG